jgi:hypothetical protein
MRIHHNGAVEMPTEYELDQMVESIRSIRQAATDLKRQSGGIEAVDRNVDRILASVRMLEINISDVAAPAGDDSP